MNILIIGGGGREHALAWRLAQSPSVKRLYAAPGNPGIAQIAACLPVPDLTPNALLAVANEINPDLTVVGPEVPLVAGVVDAFQAANRLIVGPTAGMARLEGSKIYAKRFFERLKIPTAAFVNTASHSEALTALDRFAYPVVLKADGLAAGKGVVIAANRAEALAALPALGPNLVIEEFLTGEEVSFIALCDGRDALPLAPAQDHKRVFDNDQGPNTGGMGAYSDDSLLTAAQTELVLNTVIRATVAATGFTGFLYAGLMLTASGPKVLEFNVRLGDPETQPLMHRLRSDFAQVLLASAQGRLRDVQLEWSRSPSVCVVLASGGYPGAFPAGLPITGLDRSSGVVFHAGTTQGAHGIETAGGRVLGVTASGPTLPAAVDAAYQAIRPIHFDGMHYRTDIGRRALNRYNSAQLGT